MVAKFDTKVKEMTSTQTYEAYHDICIRHYHEEITVQQFREQLTDLFTPHEQIMRTLPTFFDESGDLTEKKPLPEKPAAAGTTTQQGKKQGKAQNK